jgi:alanyl-tRNA synthetase
MGILAQAGASSLSLEPILDVVFTLAKPWSRFSAADRDRVWNMFRNEQEFFEKALARGLKSLKLFMPEGRIPDLSGEQAFQLFSTHGLPVDTIQEYVKRQGGTFDRKAFDRAFEEHQKISRGDAHARSGSESLFLNTSPSRFQGFEGITGTGILTLILINGAPVEIAPAGSAVELVLDQTVFYPEGGGQIGDQGWIKTSTGEVSILATSKTPGGHILHRGIVSSGTIKAGQEVSLQVDTTWRENTSIHHSATHLMNAALRSVLGPHVQQRGSLVTPERLRFDFAHAKPVTPDELRRIEAQVNETIRANFECDTTIMPYNKAVESGAIGMFTEKYGEEVRVVKFNGVSAELCGGTHVKATGNIGLFVISSESASAKGVRRIEASAGSAAYANFVSHRNLVREIAKKLNTNTEQLLPTLEARIAQGSSHTEKQNGNLRFEDFKEAVAHLANGTPYLLAQIDSEPAKLKDAALEFSQRLTGVVCLTACDGETARIVIAVAKTLSKQISASELLKRLLLFVDGKGGGKPELAIGGGPKIAGLAVLKEAFEQTANSLVNRPA